MIDLHNMIGNETLILISPLIYTGILLLTYIARELGLVKPIDPTFHNYNMTLQSFVLLSLTIYDYFQVANYYNLDLTDFIAVSNKGGDYHQFANQHFLWIFLASKVWEWIDTVLLIINRKKIIWLHLWHHATIVFAFYTGFHASSNFWIGSLNSFIHIIMYLYYADVKFIKPFAKYLTQLQIVQLFGGVFMNCISYNYNVGNTRLQQFSIINGVFCLSYGLMFLQFYAAKYKPKKSERETKIKPSKFIIIDGYEYDITNFKHPGGNVINYMANGQNATEAFNEFHFRSEKAKKVLKSLPHKPNEKKFDDEQILKEFAAFRADLERRGFFKPSYFHIVYRVLELIGLFAFGVYMIPRNLVISILVLGLFGGRCGWIQHEGGHNSLTGIITIDKFIQKIFLGFGLFNAGIMWNKMHNKHHATPQKIKHDIDLDTTPFVAFFDQAIESARAKYWSSLWIKCQVYTFLPITSGFIVPTFWAFYLHPREMIKNKDWFQSVCVIAGVVSRIYAFQTLLGSSLLEAIFYNQCISSVSAIYLFGHFSLSHTFTPIIKENDDPSWVRYAIEHSVDISPQNPFVSWIMGYLNCQVIHHLFPSMPQYRGPEVSLELIELCKKWNIKYTILGYGEAWRLMFKNLNDIGAHYTKGEKNA
jgi:fatty acid desaturase 2 (delta-6 desaturase)